MVIAHVSRRFINDRIAKSKPLNARETLKKIHPEVTDEMLPVLEELGL